jgi:hypothetical protein
MTKISKDLVALADELDSRGSIKLANELDKLIKEVAEFEAVENADKIACPFCNGTGEGVDEPWCPECGGSGKLGVKEAALKKTAYIRRKGKEWIVYSSKGKVLGRHPSKKKALQQLKAVEWSKANRNK